MCCPIGPMNMGASFNRTSWRMKGEVIGTEMRAFNNLAWTRRRSCTGSAGNQSCPGAAPIGLTGFGPNINVRTRLFTAYQYCRASEFGDTWCVMHGRRLLAILASDGPLVRLCFDSTLRQCTCRRPRIPVTMTVWCCYNRAAIRRSIS